MRPSTCSWLVCFLLLGGSVSSAAELVVPAFTAYADPNPRAASFSEAQGVTNWNDPQIKILWFGQLKQAGELQAAVRLRSPVEATKLRLTIGEEAHEVELPANPDKKTQTVSFGKYTIGAAGYQRFALESLNTAAGPCGEVEALLLDGPAVEGAHFNMKPRRNSASIHLSYPTPKDAKEIEWFYSEATAVDDPVQTFYMACGFNRGYLGMQVINANERWFIFSVWDSGGGVNANNRDAVAAEDQVTLVAKGEGVETRTFGGEGTGGHSHLKFPWKTGEKQRFLLAVQPEDAGKAVYSGYIFDPEQQKWRLLASFRTPRGGGYLHGLYAFSENFSGETGHLQRQARFGNQWVRTHDGRWHELTEARFSHDATGGGDRLDRGMRLDEQANEFVLIHGGFAPPTTKYGEPFHRQRLQTPPQIELPTP